MNEYEIPHTEQGLKDFIRFGKSEVKRSTLKIKNLNEMIVICNEKLTTIIQQKEKVCPEDIT